MTPTRRTVLHLAAASILAPALRAVPATAAPGGNALWIWGTGRDSWPRVAATMRRAGFATALLSVPPAERAALIGRPDALDAALAPFSDAGLSVLLAGGDPHWAVGRAPPPALDDLITLALGARTVTGVQLDVEPYTLPLWRSGAEGKERIAAGFMDLLDAARARLSGGGRTLETVLHPAFANAPLPAGHGAGSMATTMADGAIARVDGVVIMAYRNRPHAVARFAARLLDSLDAQPRPWRFGLTTQAGPEDALISYAGADYAAIAADIAALGALAATRRCAAAYRGVAVHDYRSLAPKLAP